MTPLSRLKLGKRDPKYHQRSLDSNSIARLQDKLISTTPELRIGLSMLTAGVEEKSIAQDSYDTITPTYKESYS